MTMFLNAFAFALLTTALFAMRFGEDVRRRTLVAYFALFFAVEWGAARFYFPEDAMGIEVAITCFALTVPVGVAIVLIRRSNRNAEE